MTHSYEDILKDCNLDEAQIRGGALSVFTPVDGSKIADVPLTKADDMPEIAKNAQAAFKIWRSVPAPVRGEFVRLLGQELRDNKEELSRLVTLECGKILSEGRGEVQEMIDICDFAVGLSRQLYGLTIASERPGHHMRETWQPLGPVAVITAFNFPVAVWSWNSALALVCGNSLVWKPSEKTPLTALACEKIFLSAARKFKEAGHKIPENLLQVVIGERDIGEALSNDAAYPLVSATGSTRMGKAVAKNVASRLGKSLLELGGNNAMIVAPSADLDMAVRAAVFGAVGTCGQRCTSLRRLIVHESVYDSLVEPLVKAYKSVRIGSPLDSDTLVGPMIDEDAFNGMQKALQDAKAQGGKILAGGERFTDGNCTNGFYVAPAIVEMPEQSEIVKHETFAPILYVMKYNEFSEAIDLQNDVPQGLSSCIFSTNMRESEFFLSVQGSDCGIANVNIGTSGAEIGGAFGGEKETGGGRESGSDAWKVYMRRQTQTINYSEDMPLAQGVVFDI
ncbi:MAG: aldehyde dehydrogenase family protein [Alphaproteobacteria bacterium]